MTTITALPPAPSRTDPTTFSSKSDALLGALDQFVTETNTVAGEVVSNRDLASTYATNASNSASAASTSASTAATQAGLATTNGAAQVSLATTQANNAASSASTATTQAGTATTQAGIATTQAGIATTQAGIATTKAGEAATSAAEAAASAASISSGPVTSVNGMTGVVTGLQDELVSGTNIKTVNSTSLLGSGDVAVQSTLVSGTNIKTVQGTSLLGSGDVSIGVSRSTRTSNTILGTADKGYFIDITSGTFTQTFTAAATLANGWWCYIRNSGTGDITLDPNSSEQIDGLTSYVMYPGETRLIQCTGSAFFSFIISGFYKTFTSTGTFTTPPGYRLFEGLLWSGGSSGQRASNSASLAGGGGGGGCYPFRLPASMLSTSETITIGAGGAAVTGIANGNVGGSSSIGSILTVASHVTWSHGGSVAIAGNTLMNHSTYLYAVGFEGAQPSNSVIISSTIWGGAAGSGANPGYPGNSLYGGGGGGGSYGSGTGVAAGTSVFGGNGGAYGYLANGTAGSAPGGGGGGSSGGSQSGAGGRGECRIWGIV